MVHPNLLDAKPMANKKKFVKRSKAEASDKFKAALAPKKKDEPTLKRSADETRKKLYGTS